MSLSTRYYLISVITLLTSLIYAVMSHRWDLFARSGSLVVVFGLLLTSRQVISNANTLDRYRGAQHDWAGEAEARSRVRHHKTDDEDWQYERSGFYLIVIGTLVWGFGDLPGLY